MRYWLIFLILFICPPAHALVEARVDAQSASFSSDYQWFEVGRSEGRSYNYFLEYGLDDDTGLGLTYHRLRSGSDRVTLGGAYAKAELHESRGGRSHTAAYVGFHVRHLTTPGVNVNLTGFQVGIVATGNIIGRLRALGRFGADIYKDDTFWELELAAGFPLSSLGELQAGYRSITSSRARDDDTVDGLFLGLSIPLSRPRPLRW